MKLILLHLKLLFTSRSTRKFFKILFISLPFALYIVYYAIVTNQNFKQAKSLYEKIEHIGEKSISSNSQIIIHHSVLRESKNTNLEPSAHFWESTALQPRYLLPYKGNPDSY